MDHVTTAEHAAPAEHAHAEHTQGFLRTYIFSVDHKVIGIQYAVTGLLFLLFGFTLMLLMRWQLAYPFQPIPHYRGLVGPVAGSGRRDAPRVLQSARRHARHHHGLSGCRAACRRRVWELRPAPPDWCARHGVPEAQHGELLVVFRRRRRHVRQLLCPRRRSELGMDVVSATLGDRHNRSDHVVARHGVAHHVVTPRFDQFHRDDCSASGTRAQLHAVAGLRLGAAGDVIPLAPRLSPARSRWRPAVDGPRRGH